MKTICFFSSNLNNSGGTERVASIIANELSDNGYNVIFLSLFEGLNPYYDISEKIKIHTLSKNKISLKYNYLLLIFKLRNFLKKNKVNSIINIESTLSLFVTPAVFNTKARHINWEHFNFTVSLGKKNRVLSRYIAAFFADYIVTLTTSDKEIWQKKTFLRSKIIAIPNPCPKILIESIPSKANKIALSVGRYTTQKGFDSLILSWKEVNRKHPDWQLWIVGDGEEKENLVNLIGELNLVDSIKLLPFTKDINSYYQKASFYILSSRYEGLPMVLLEACSFSLPLISFDCLTGPKEIISSGVNGFLVKNQDIPSLSFTINNMIEIDQKKYSTLCTNSQKTTLQFDTVNIIKQWDSILKEL